MAEMDRFDAIVVGSGISGGWAAKELTEQGLKVLLLDRGVMVEHGSYDFESAAPFDIPARDRMPARERDADYFIAQHGYVSPASKKHYNNDRLNPYVYDEGSKFYWIRPGAVGGKSLIWGRWSFRWAPLDFEANKRDGHGIDWPIRYEDLEPWYGYVERYAGISGSRENLPYLPDSEFQPPMPMNIAEQWVKQRLEARFPGRKVINARLSNMTEDKPDQGRAKCQMRNQCSRGCSFGAYFSTQAVTLPAAQATGRLTLRSEVVVTNLIYDAQRKRATGVRLVNTRTGQAEEIAARLIVLGASTVATVQILMNTRTADGNRSVFDSSGTLGAYMMDHIFRVGATGDVPAHDDLIEYGRRPGGVYIPRFRNLSDADQPGFHRGYGYQGSARRDAVVAEGFGAEMKHKMRAYGPWRFNIGAFGECLPYADNRMSLHATRKDRFGMPLVRFDVTFRENELKMMADARQQSEAMLTAAGLVNVSSSAREHVPGDGIHEMGGARMGADPRQSVTDRFSRLHDAANVYVVDGAQMASVSCVNPSLTFMALSARACDHAIKAIKAGSI